MFYIEPLCFIKVCSANRVLPLNLLKPNKETLNYKFFEKKETVQGLSLNINLSP